MADLLPRIESAARPKSQTLRSWLSGLSITVATIIGLFAFWRISPGLTYLVALGAMLVLTVSIWIAGKD